MTASSVELIATDASTAPALLAPFDEQTSFDVDAGRRTLFAVRRTQEQAVVGSAVLGGGALDLHIAPEFRAQGSGGAAAAQLLERAGDGPLTAWSHDDHPAARALAARFGFGPIRTLLLLRLAPLPGQPAVDRFDTFRPGADDAEWLALNAHVFAWHPEQGAVSADDLAQRMTEPWFDAGDFLVARDEEGAMVGYCWLKVEPGQSTGEIYVIGVAPEASGRGLGRALMNAGLTRLSQRGCTAAELYVESDNAPAIRLYRGLGFRDAQVHVQYARRAVTG